MNYQFLNNSLMKFNNIEINETTNIRPSSDENTLTALRVPLYDRTRILQCKKILQNLNTTWLAKKRVPNNMSIEKITLDIYGTTRYWDIILLLNNRMPIFDMPYDYDIISDTGNQAVADYEDRVYHKQISNATGPDGKTTRERFLNAFQERSAEENEIYQNILYIKKEHIYDVLNIFYDAGIM